MSAIAKDLSQETAFLDGLRWHHHAFLEAADAIGFPTLDNWSDVCAQAPKHLTDTRKSFRRTWLSSSPAQRDDFAGIVISQGYFVMAKLECVRTVKLANGRMHHAD